MGKLNCALDVLTWNFELRADDTMKRDHREFVFQSGWKGESVKKEAFICTSDLIHILNEIFSSFTVRFPVNSGALQLLSNVLI